MAHTTGPRPNSDTNYGVVGTNTLRTAAQIGNENGEADFNTGPATDQTLRVAFADGSTVILTTLGSGVFIFAELPAVPVAVETTLVAYVPGVPHKLKRAIASGDADAEFQLKVNGSKIARKRNNWTERNVDFDFSELGIPIAPGDLIEITVLSKGASACPFDGTIYGEE